MDGIFPTTGNYKVNAAVNDILLDECSFAGLNDVIYPFFEDPVFDDPDVTGLMVFLKNSKGEIAGWKIKYVTDDNAEDIQNEVSTDVTSTDTKSSDNKTDDIKSTDALSSDDKSTDTKSTDDKNSSDQKPADNETADDEEDNGNINTSKDISGDDETDEPAENTEINPLRAAVLEFEAKYKQGEEIVFQVNSLDKDLPFFPIPGDLPMGRYTLVFNVMGGEEILQKTEKNFFYMADTEFSFESIQVHFPGIAGGSQLVPKGTVIMLETDLVFDKTSGKGDLDPYVIWYDGKKIISEGNFSEGAGYLLWKTPEQSGFFSLRAEILPTENRRNLSGYQKDISLLVSSKPVELNLITEDTSSLMQWYIFEGNLNDSKLKSLLVERSIVSAEENLVKKTPPKWMPSGGTYGLAAGINDAYILPNVSFSNEGIDTWQMLFRFKPLSEGRIFSAQFGFSDILIDVSLEKNNLVLTLSSFLKTVSKSYGLPNSGGFITAALDFSVWPDHLTAQLNIDRMVVADVADEEEQEPLSIEAFLEGDLEIMLGLQKEVAPDAEKVPVQTGGKTNQPIYTALWDEIAIFHKQFTEIEKEVNVEADEDENEIAEEDDEYEEFEGEQTALLAASVNDDSDN